MFSQPLTWCGPPTPGQNTSSSGVHHRNMNRTCQIVLPEVRQPAQDDLLMMGMNFGEVLQEYGK